MKAIATSQRQDLVTKKRKKLRQEKTKKKQELKKQSRIRSKNQKFTLEWDHVLKKYPKTKYKQIMLRNIPPELRTRFHAKCAENDITVIGKLRYLMFACASGIIKDSEIVEKMEDCKLPNLFDLTPDYRTVVYNDIPVKIHQDFKRWCALHDYKMAPKLRSLMIAYLGGFIP
jgi:transcriptional accessory protein Tex/SPT6